MADCRAMFGRVMDGVVITACGGRDGNHNMSTWQPRAACVINNRINRWMYLANNNNNNRLSTATHRHTQHTFYRAHCVYNHEVRDRNLPCFMVQLKMRLMGDRGFIKRWLIPIREPCSSNIKFYPFVFLLVRLCLFNKNYLEL